MKKLIVRFAGLVTLGLLVGIAYGQSGKTAVTGTVACYANGSVQAQWINGNPTSPTPPNLGGQPFAQAVPGNLNSSGVFNLSLGDVNQIQPQPSTWNITACAKGGSQPLCYTASVAVTGSSMNVSSYFTSAPCPAGTQQITQLTQDVLATGPGSVPATVVGANGALIPTNAGLVGTNGLGQFVAAGSGSGFVQTIPAGPQTVTQPSGTSLIANSFGGAIFNVKGYGATGNGSTDDTASITAAISALTTNGGGTLYFPKGTYLTSTCNFTLSVPTAVKGDTEPSIDLTNMGSSIVCASGTAKLFNVTASIVTFSDIGLFNGQTTNPTAGAGIYAASSSATQEVDLDRTTVWGFYDNVDINNGAFWHMIANHFIAPVRYDLYLQNTVQPDQGDGVLAQNNFNAGACYTYATSSCSPRNPTALVKWTSGGGLKVSANKFNTGDYVGGGYPVHSFVADFTGVASGELNFVGNTLTGATQSSVTLTAMSFVYMEDNYLDNQTGYPCLTATGLNQFYIGGGTCRVENSPASGTGISISGDSGTIGPIYFQGVTTPTSITNDAGFGIVGAQINDLSTFTTQSFNSAINGGSTVFSSFYQNGGGAVGDGGYAGIQFLYYSGITANHDSGTLSMNFTEPRDDTAGAGFQFYRHDGTKLLTLDGNQYNLGGAVSANFQPSGYNNLQLNSFNFAANTAAVRASSGQLIFDSFGANSSTQGTIGFYTRSSDNSVNANPLTLYSTKVYAAKPLWEIGAAGGTTPLFQLNYDGVTGGVTASSTGVWNMSSGATIGNGAAITAYSITSNVATFTASNSFSSGQTVTIGGFGTSTFLDNVSATIATASGSQFTIPFTHANASATEAGFASVPLASAASLATDGQGKIIAGTSGGLIVGTTTITSGTNGKVEYNNSGVLGELSASTTVNGQTCTLGSTCTVTAAPSSTVTIAQGGTGTSSTLTGLVRGSASAMTAAEISGDCTTSGSNAITCTKTSGTAFGTAATVNTGTSGATIPLLNGANTWSAPQTFSYAGTTATFTDTQSGSIGAVVANFTAPNVIANSGVVLNVGTALSTYNAFQFQFGIPTSGGTGSNKNFGFFNIYGRPGLAVCSDGTLLSGTSFPSTCPLLGGGVDTPFLYNTAAQTTVSCSTSGTAVFSQPDQGSSDKKVLIHMAACLGTASYTFPTAFTNTPSVYASNNVAASIATSVSTTAVTVTGATTTGSLLLEDY